MRSIKTSGALLLIFVQLLLNLPGARAQKPWTVVHNGLVFSGAPFKQCHASTMVSGSGGKLLLACFGGSGEGQKDVSIWLTVLDGHQFAAPRMVADGVVNDTLRYAAWNPVLFRTRRGKLLLFYKVGPNPRAWWGMVKSSTDDGQTWSAASRLPGSLIGPVKNKPVLLTDGTILSPSSVEQEDGRWRAHLERSADDGESWQYIPLDTAGKFDVIQPSLLSYPGGRLQVLCRSKQGRVIQAWSADQGQSWTPLSPTSLPNPNSGTDAVTLSDGTQLIVYNPDVPGKDWFNGRGKLRVARSADGEHWEDILVLENGDTQEFSYPAIIQTSDGLVHISYTYDRKNIRYVVVKP